MERRVERRLRAGWLDAGAQPVVNNVYLAGWFSSGGAKENAIRHLMVGLTSQRRSMTRYTV